MRVPADLLARAEALADAGPSAPRPVAGLPPSVAVWLRAELLDYARAGVPDAEITEVERFYRAPEVSTLFAGGAPRAKTEQEVFDGMRALAVVVRSELRRRGYRVDPDTSH